jgi:predicted glycogen debranching enzyme
MRSLNRGDFTQDAGALEREWLVTNGLGGFAAGTIAQANTRRYHGLLVATLRPPVERVVMVAKLDCTVGYRGERFELGCNEFADGALSPRGHRLLRSFDLDGGIPTWRYALADAEITQRVWMERGRNTTYVSFTLEHGTATVELELTPLCTYRDYHAHSHGGWSLGVKELAHGCEIEAFAGARPYRLWLEDGKFVAAPDWYWRFSHRLEAERGLDALEDLFRPGYLRVSLVPGQTAILTLSAEPQMASPGAGALERELRRQRSLLQGLPDAAPAWIRQLALAADQFIVQRAQAAAGETGGTTIIAGYPWFTDWGRDTMIALPGLTLGSGRVQDAAAILRTFAAHVSRGMLPNRFPDGGEAPEYNTADATLWYFHAIASYLQATADRQLLNDLYPTLKQIIAAHQTGTRYGIQVDQHDGLLRAGEPGVQLTWMDAKVGEWVVTPRTGKPVEINALWHFALSQMARWARQLNDVAAEAAYSAAAARVAASFANSFWYETGGYLYDVIDGPEGADASLRPNQIFAVSLGGGLLGLNQARAVVDICGRDLLTPVGLRSLSPRDQRYVRRYGGDQTARDGAYHQGTVWSWLLGPYALAHHAVYGDTAHAKALLAGLEPHLGEACLGNLSEIFDAEAPHTPRGCFAQAWSVAETLRAWTVLTARAEPSTTFARASGD